MAVVVVGGGVIGCSIAYELAKARASVVLLERGQIGGEASGASAGMLIAPIEDAGNRAFNDLRRASLSMYPEVLSEVQQRSGVDVQHSRCGMLRTAWTEDFGRRLRQVAKRAGLADAEWLTGDELRALEPALTAKLAGALFSPGDAELNPHRLTQAFAEAARRLGADVREGEMLTGFLRLSAHVEGVSTNLGDVRGVDAVVLAAGPWTEPLSMRLRARLRTPPMRGQMLAYRSRALRHAIWGEDGYLIPKPGGFVYAGATVEDVGFRKSTTARGLAGLRNMAARLVPKLRGAEVASAWAGLRPGSGDGMPVIGRVPGQQNVYVATGHFRNGVLLAPVTGKLVAEMLLTGRVDRLLKPFSPQRFG